MKTKISALLLAVLMLFTCASLLACNDVKAEGLWKNATYRSDCELGDGAKTVEVKIEAVEESITLSIKTDKDSLADAMKEHDLLVGENGLYTTVNGITADWDEDQSWWMLCKDGEATNFGADDAPVNGGEKYAFIYTK